MNRRTLIVLAAALVMAAGVSCATISTPTASGPPEVKVSVIDFYPTTQVGDIAEINFSVTNLTDRELTGLTLTVSLNPSNGVDVPYYEKAIDRIVPGGSWNPGRFVVRARHSGTTSVFFYVRRGDVILARDYALVNVAPGDTPFEHRY